MSNKGAKLILEDGTVFEGTAFGSQLSTSGEVGEWNYCTTSFFCIFCFELSYDKHELLSIIN